MRITWPLDPSVYLGLVVLLLGYAWLARERLDNTARPLYFLAGVMTLWIALETPVDTTGDRYLQSVHMFQHVLLSFVAPPLLVLGLSPAMAGLLVRRIPLLGGLCRPILAQTIAAAVMVFWHLPGPYDLTELDERVHILEHLTMMVAGVFLWWPLLEASGSTLRTPLHEGARLAYALVATLPQDGIALVLQFSGHVFYSAYASGPIIIAGWTPVIDQNVAGVVLQLAGKVSFVILGIVLLYRWIEREQPAQPEELHPAR
ncbi:MAG: cytochrome c oxidase assembly protein [Candidatus Dormibacteraeota bacterium]|nr:cytochrome c oxidase assembly protein [Candidatus Dormibacteraeota bacterium]